MADQIPSGPRTLLSTSRQEPAHGTGADFDLADRLPDGLEHPDA